MLDYRDLPKEPGVYMIKHTESGRCYIGSSKNIRTRCYEHIRTLRKSKHHSQFLQRVWNKSEETSFQIEVLEICPVEILLRREQHYMDTLLPEYNMTPNAKSREGVKATEEEKIANRERVRAWWAIEENKNMMSKIGKDRFKMEGAKEAARQISLEYNKAHPEKGKRHSKVMKEKFEDPKFYKKFLVAMQNRDIENPEWRENNSKAIINKWKDPIYRRKNSAISDEQAVEIIKLKRTKIKHREIAEIIGCQKSVVDNISCNKTYRHIDRETLEIDPEYL